MEIYAHRGHSGVAPENTLPAFHSAILHGATAIECDLRVTKDGEFVICHDSTINRTSNAEGKISKISFRQLRKLDFGCSFSRRFAGTKIPHLEEVLKLGEKLSRINIEIKDQRLLDREIFQRFYDLIHKYQLVDKVLLSSFHAQILSFTAKWFPDLKTGYLYKKPKEDIISFAKENRFHAIHPKYTLLTKELVERAKKAGLEVNTWTPNFLYQMRRCIHLKVSGIITNHPYKTVKLLSKNLLA